MTGTLLDSQNSCAMAATATNAGARPARLRILQVVPVLDVGGTEMAMLRVLHGLAEESFEQRVCAVRHANPSLLEGGRFGEVLVAGDRSARQQIAVMRLARLMKTVRPHIVHSRNWGAIEAIAAARLARVPVIIHSEHGYEPDILAGLPLRRRLIRRTLYAMCDVLFTVSNELRDYHARQGWVSPERIRVIYNGVDTRKFAPDAQARRNVREKYGVGNDCFLVGSVGRMVAIKDHVTLLKAAEELVERGVNVRVLLVGEGPELESHRLYVRNSRTIAERVIFAGESRQIPALVNAMDAFVLPSLCEGMSNTLLEAMACGVPAVATNVGGNPEVLGREMSAWMFAPRDVGDLAEKLAALAAGTELCRELGAAGRTRAAASFSLERMLEQYTALYQHAASKRGVPRSA